MEEKSINIIDALGSHFAGALSEPADALNEIRDELLQVQSSKRYTFIRDIAEGGLKKVTLEKDGITHRSVAISILKEDQPEEEILRFINEAYITARLEHNNNVPLYDFGLRGDSFYFATKYLDGKTFSHFLKPETELKNKLDVFVEICHGMSFAHSRGIVHLDLKPTNVQVSEHGEVTIFDWGLARDIITDDGLESFFDEKFAGSPGFTAAEQIQCQNDEIDQQTDIFSLGAILYQILTNEIPWQHVDPQQVLKGTLSGDVRLLEARLSKASAPASLSSVCLKALQLDKAKRYDSVDELQQEVQDYLNGFATRAEEASYFKMLYLLINRHKLPFFMTVLFLIVLSTTFSVYQSRLKEENIKIAELNKSKSRLLYNKALVHYKKFELEAAEKDLLESLRLDPQEHSLELKSDILIVKGEYLEALTILNNIKANSEIVNRAHEVLRKLDLMKNSPSVDVVADKILRQHLPGTVLFMIKYKYAQMASLEERIQLAKILLKKMNGVKSKFSFIQNTSGFMFKADSQLSRLIPLVDFPLTHIDVTHGVCYNIEALRGMKTLRSLNLSNTYVEDLSPLRGLKLDYLNISNTCVVDLKPLEKSSIKILDIRGQKLKYLTSLMTQRNIEKVLMDESKYTSYRDRRELRVLKEQKRIIYE